MQTIFNVQAAPPVCAYRFPPVCTIPSFQPSLPPLPAGLIDLFDRESKTAREINVTVMALKKALTERALSGEMNHHLGYPP